MKFSERIRKGQRKVAVQLDSMDEELRNSLWNVLLRHIFEPIECKYYVSDTEYRSFIISMWFSFFKEPTDQIPNRTSDITDEIRKKFFSWSYFEIYDFIEFVASDRTIPYGQNAFIVTCNVVLRKELSGYRFLKEQLIQITNEAEILEINRAFDNISLNELEGVNSHLLEAFKMISDKKSPDYINSISESVAAVESLCSEISGKNNVPLSDAFCDVKTKVTMHSPVEQVFNKLFEYVGNIDSIKEGLKAESSIDQEDAIFVLITCSAFVNYLIVKANKIGIDFKIDTESHRY